MPQHTEDVQIDWNRVNLLAESVRSLDLAPDRHDYMVPPCDIPDDRYFEAILWCAAVCHSTKGALAGHFAGRFYKGWDYLLRAFLHHAAVGSAEQTIQEMRVISADELFTLLQADNSANIVRFADLNRRAQILRATANELLSHFVNVPSLLKEGQEQKNGAAGYYQVLDRLEAFRDPLRKKSSAFLMTVYYSNRWDFANDINGIEPMIDYHRMRVLLRTGCITVDATLNADLANHRAVAVDVENRIRFLSRKICLAVPELTGWNMFDFDVSLWTHARSCCRNSPVCVSGAQENGSFIRFVKNAPMDECVFQSWCPGASDESYRLLWEPVIATENY